MRLRAWVLAVATAVGIAGAIAPAPARAQDEPRVRDATEAPAATFVPIAPPPPAETVPQVPALDPPPDLTGLQNRPVTHFSVTFEGNVWDDVQAPSVVSLKVGDTLTAAASRAALRELLRSGRFARGRIFAQVDGAGVAVTARMVPRKLVDHLQVETHGGKLDVDEILRSADLAEGGEIVGSEIDATTRRVERTFAVHGYPAAKARIQMRDTDDPTRTTVFLDVEPGEPRLIGDRRFYTFGAESDRALRAARSYAVSVGDRADTPVLEQADGGLEQLLRSKGWHRAAVSHDLVWVTAPGGGGRVVLRVRLDTGPYFVARFEGNEHYDADALTAALALDTETDRSLAHLADKIRAYYEKRGYLDAQVRADLRSADDPVQIIFFHVEEHARVRVASRRYPCLKVDAIKNLNAGGPASPAAVGTEIDSYLDEELPGADLFFSPDPRGVDATIGSGAGQVATGKQVVPVDLDPDSAYVADTYERAVEHVQGLYRNEGFLHAEVGPIGVVRARCDPHSPAGRCVPLPLPRLPTESCAYDPSGQPLAVDPLDPSFTCRPDPPHGVECAPVLDLVIPIKLGPRTRLWDLAFSGLRAMSERDVAAAAEVPLGEPVSTIKLEDARRRIADWYKEQGYYYADVKYTLEPSADSTRARVRFDVAEGEQVIVRAIVIRGLDVTRESVVRRRIALAVNHPYRASDVRRTQERIATLGVFSSITVGLSDPYVPQASKDVIVEVVERPGHYIELSPGFSTGEGVRGTFEYDERNILGYAIGATFRAQLSYLPDFLILDPQVAANYQQVQDRLARRITLSGAFPEIGLGPLVRAQGDAIYVRDLERDFTLDKISASGTLIYRPGRELQVALGPSIEDNDIRLFQFNSVSSYIACSGTFNSALASLLRVPDGESLVVAQHLSVAWDRRDNAFNAHSGSYVFLGAEFVNAFPEGAAVVPNVANAAVAQCSNPDTGKLSDAPQAQSQFVRLTQTFAGYIPISKSVSFAAELRLGENVRTATCKFSQESIDNPSTCTYPDRLFFMGGFDSMRGWLQDTFIPQDYADQVAATPSLCTSSSSSCLVPLRGGNLMVNPRVELRFPVRQPLMAAFFADFGNLYVDPTYVFDHRFTLRADVGAGIRVDTPVGPLVFDYGINVTRRPYEDFGAFHFAIGLF